MSIRRRIMMGGMKGQKVPANQIWYTTNDGSKIDFTLSGLTMISNTFDGEKWVAEFDGDVTGIGNNTFKNCTSLASIMIPDSVTSIGSYTFYGCYSLTSVKIPDSVTSIGEGAFYGVLNIIYHGTASGSPWSAKCVNGYFEGALLYTDSSKTELVACADKSITSVTIPNSVTSIGDETFSDCTALASVTIGNSVTSIGSSAFSYCRSLASVNMPDSVTSIGDYTFYNCRSLASVNIPDSVTSIGNYTFEGCTALPVIDNIRYADTYLVGAKDKTLSSYSIKDGTRFIGTIAFSYCRSLTSVTIPDSVKSIGYQAFYICTSLASVTIPDSVTSIGSDAFKNVPHIEYHGTATGSPWGAKSMN